MSVEERRFIDCAEFNIKAVERLIHAVETCIEKHPEDFDGRQLSLLVGDLDHCKGVLSRHHDDVNSYAIERIKEAWSKTR